MSMFAGTAQFYDQFRPGIPDELVDHLVLAASRYSLAHSLLDVGTGTGRVLEQFLPHFKDIVAIEPDFEMLEIAKRRLIPHMPADESIFFLDGSAEIVQFPPNWSASLVTICRAFHWLDQPLVLKRLDEVVESRGVVAIFSDKSFWTAENPWMQEVRSIVQSFLGEERRAGSDLFSPPVTPYKEVLGMSAFSDIEEFTLPIKRTWSYRQILGYLYSTSFAAQANFGDNRGAFEQALKDKLHRMMPNDVFVEENEFDVLLARRPSAGF